MLLPVEDLIWDYQWLGKSGTRVFKLEQQSGKIVN